MHIQHNHTLRLTGWIQPFHAFLSLDALSLLIVGSIAADEPAPLRREG